MEFSIPKLTEEFTGKNVGIREVSPLILAYIGDSVFEIIARTYVVYNGVRHIKEINIVSDKIVNAKAQRAMYNIIKDSLTNEELSYFKRGRNAKTNSSPKNASLSDYSYATGLESLFGYLYLSENMKRAYELFTLGINGIKE